LMTMVPHEAARAIAVLHFAVGVCRGMLYSASFGDAEKADLERILNATSGYALADLLGEQTYAKVMALAAVLPREDKEALHGIV
jgi:hypothetical protein